jgi:hypothetical protein
LYNRQVFWLKAISKTFPLLAVVSLLNLCYFLFRLKYEEASYSYGDSAGLSPDFPFNHAET